MSNPTPTYPAFRWDDTARDLVFTWSGGHEDPVQIHSGRSVESAQFKLSRAFIAAAESSMLDLSDVLELWQTQCAAWQLPADPGAEAAAVREDTAYRELRAHVAAAKNGRTIDLQAVVNAETVPDPGLVRALAIVFEAASDLVLVREGEV